MASGDTDVNTGNDEPVQRERSIRTDTSQEGPSFTERSKENLREVVSRSTTKNELKNLIGQYALIGLGMGLVGFFIAGVFAEAVSSGGSNNAITQAFGQILGAAIQLMALIVFVLLGPALAVIFAPHVERRLTERDIIEYGTIGIGCGVGHLAMTFVGLFIISQQGAVNATSGSGGFGGIFGTLLIIATITGLVGAGAMYFAKGRTRSPAGMT